MKKYMSFVFMIALSIGSSLNSAINYYDEPADYVAVQLIHQHTNITQDDVDKVKLLMLGGLQDVAAAGAGTYAAYKVGMGVHGTLASLEAAASTKEKKTFSTAILAMLGKYAPTDSKLLWAAAGAAGAGFAAYKILYPRIERGVLAQVQAYVDFCHELEVVGAYYRYYDNYPQALYFKNGSKSLPGTIIAQFKGVEDLIQQGRNSLSLLNYQLASSEQANNLKAKVEAIIVALESYTVGIRQGYQLALQRRQQEISQGMYGAQQAAQLRFTQEQESALRVGKFSLALTTLTNAFDKTLKTLVYIGENRAKIASGLLVGGMAVYGGIELIKSKIMGE